MYTGKRSNLLTLMWQSFGKKTVTRYEQFGNGINSLEIVLKV